MRISITAAAALVLAFVAFVILVVVWATWEFPLYAVFVALAAVLVALATFFRFGRHLPRAARIPVEDFSIWSEVGEPAAELKRFGPEEVASASRIASSDLGLIASNASLLSERLAILVGRKGFEELTESKLHRDAYGLTERLYSLVKRLGAQEGWSAEGAKPVLEEMESCAAHSDRMANKLFEFQREKTPEVRACLEPLRRAAEKLSRDLRLMASNLSAYLSRVLAAPRAPESEVGRPEAPEAGEGPPPEPKSVSALAVEACRSPTLT